MTRLVIRDRDELRRLLDEYAQLSRVRGSMDADADKEVLEDAIVAANFSLLTAQSGEQGREAPVWLKVRAELTAAVEVCADTTLHHDWRDWDHQREWVQGIIDGAFTRIMNELEPVDAARSTQNSETPSTESAVQDD